MRLRKHQAGLGMLGWLVILAAAAFVLTCAFKLGPIYLNYWETKEALDLVLKNPQAARQSPDELRSAIRRQFLVSEIDTVAVKDIKFTNTQNGREINASYEKRVPLMFNIDVVVKFDHLIYKLPPAE